MNHGKLNAAPWSIDVPLKAGMVVTFQNGFYQSLKGRNVAEPLNNSDFVYLGEVDRFGTFARRNAANLSTQDVSDWIAKLNIYTIPEVDELLTKKADLVDGVVPASQLPSYVDDVIEGYRKDADGLFYKNANFTGPITGESGKLYLDLINSETYRWTGTVFAFVGAKTFKLAMSNQDDGANGYEIVNEAVSILGFYNEEFVYVYLPDPNNPALNIPTISLKKKPFGQPILTDKYLPVWNNTTKAFDDSQIYQAADGRIGIGKTNPANKLDVNGKIKGDVLISKTYTVAERNAITSPVEGMLIYQNESPKGFYQYQNGEWSPMGQNIAANNLTWINDRTQNLGTKKLSFTNGRFSVPTLEMEVTTATSIPNKIWNDGDYAKYTDKNGINKTLGFDGDCTCVITTAVNITTNTIGDNGKSQHGREVAIANGSNNITLTCEINSEADFIASYTKEGAGSITIVAGVGATLLKADGIDLIGGIPGSSFCIKRRGTQFQIFISNR